MKWKIVAINGYKECGTRLVILLEIVMVIPVKYQFHFKKQRVQS